MPLLILYCAAMKALCWGVYCRPTISCLGCLNVGRVTTSDSEMKERWSVKHHTHKSSAYHTKPNQTNFFIIEFSAQIQHRFITALGVRKVMDSSAGQLRLDLGCQCKDDTVQPSLGLHVSAKYLHSAHAFSAFLRHFRYLMGIIKVLRWFEHKILVLKHPWKSKIGLLEQILG